MFVIETKAWSRHGNATIACRADEVLVGGRRPDRGPLAQVTAPRRWPADVIKQSCALTPPLRAVILFPGPCIGGASSGREVRVLNEKVLPRFIEEDPMLPEGDAARIASMLAARSRHRTDGA